MPWGILKLKRGLKIFNLLIIKRIEE